MITDSYDIETKPIIELSAFYGKQKHLIDTCLIIFSREIHDYLLKKYDCKVIGEMKSCRENIPIYTLTYKEHQIAFYLSLLGSTQAACNCVETWWLTGARNFIMFGSCGILNGEATKGKFIIPSKAYRGEGLSYYFAPASDYINIKNCNKLAKIFDDLHLPYVVGSIWTTDTMLRETVGLVEKRKNEGCIAVEMEVAGVEAVCDFYDLNLYDFLQAGDVLDLEEYDNVDLDHANNDLSKLYIALDIALILD